MSDTWTAQHWPTPDERAAWARGEGLEPVPLMEGRFVCCGKLPHAGHAHDCPELPKSMTDEEVFLAVMEADLCRLSSEALNTAEGRKRVASALVAKGWKWGAK